MEFWDRCSSISSNFLIFKLVFEENDCLYQETQEQDEKKPNLVSRSLRYNEDLEAWSSKKLFLLVYGGGKKMIVDLNDIKEFIVMHQNVYWVTYGIELEFYVISTYLNNIGATKIDSLWRNLVGIHRLIVIFFSLSSLISQEMEE